MMELTIMAMVLIVMLLIKFFEFLESKIRGATESVKASATMISLTESAATMKTTTMMTKFIEL